MTNLIKRLSDIFKGSSGNKGNQRKPLRISTSKFISENLKVVSERLDEISKYTGQVFIVMHSDTLKALEKTDNWPQIRSILENRGMLFDREAAIREP